MNLLTSARTLQNGSGNGHVAAVGRSVQVNTVEARGFAVDCVKVTFDTYGHLFPDGARSSASRVGDRQILWRAV